VRDEPIERDQLNAVQRAFAGDMQVDPVVCVCDPAHPFQ